MSNQNPNNSDANVWASTTITVGGASMAAGAATTIVTAVSAFGLNVPLWVSSVAGIGAFVLGGIGAFLAKKIILDKVEKDSKSIETEHP